jgi:hypothetical protein
VSSCLAAHWAAMGAPIAPRPANPIRMTRSKEWRCNLSFDSAAAQRLLRSG